MNTETLFNIVRLTVRYDQKEDRMALNAESRGGETRRFWLTRRLADRFVPKLLTGLEVPPEERCVLEGSSPDSSAVPISQIYAQLEARLAKKPAAPVRAPPDGICALIHEITVSQAKRNCRLIFRCHGSEPAQLVLSAMELRQWMEVLHRAYVRADWDVGCWPGWFRSSVSAQ